MRLSFSLARYFLISVILFFSQQGFAQGSALSRNAGEEEILKRRLEALATLEREDTLSASAFWPNIRPSFFFANIRKNLEQPTKINQGNATNFCGYAAMTHILLTYQPGTYLRHILALYRTGKTSLDKRELTPSERVRKAAGTLHNKGELDILLADQLWFLTLADQFKGYMNIFDHKYNPGDENKIWAGTNYGKFNSMLRDFTHDSLTSRGTDFLRPALKDFYEYLNESLQHGVVMLFVNSKYLYPHKYTLFKLRAPTHFIVLYELNKVEDDLIEMKYWDYGLKTQQFITRKRLFKLIFGITTISKYVHE